MINIVWQIVLFLCVLILGIVMGYSIREVFTEGKLTFDFREEAQAPVIIKLDDIPDKKTVCLNVEYLQDKETDAKAVIDINRYKEGKK